MLLWRRAALVAAMASAAAVSGCAGDGGAGPGGPGVNASASCRETRHELDRMDARGVPSLIEASNAGKKLSSRQQGDVDRYNRLLKVYLGSRCHL